MHYKVEGILIRKIPHKERDLIGSLLLRNGKTISGVFYGGMGGGKKNKPSILESGRLFEVGFVHKKKELGDGQLVSFRDYSLKWTPKNIRTNYQAFYLLNFFLEFISKVTFQASLESLDDGENEEIFRLLSNAIFYLEKSVTDDLFELETQMLLFLTKACLELGIAPSFRNCGFCEKQLAISNLASFDFENGGFVCSECAEKGRDFQNTKEMWVYFSQVWFKKYSEYHSLPKPTLKTSEELFTGTLRQFNLSRSDFKSTNLIW